MSAGPLGRPESSCRTGRCCTIVAPVQCAAGPTGTTSQGDDKHVRPIELKPLTGRLNDVCRRALEAAAGATALRTHYDVEIEHFLIGLLDKTDNDLAAVLRPSEI